MISRRDTASALLFATLGALFIDVEPAIASSMGAAFHLGTQRLGTTLALESVGMLVGGVVAFALMHRLKVRATVLYSLLLYVVANAVTVATRSVPALDATRVLAGIAEGSLVAIAFAMIALDETPHRVFGAFGILQTVCEMLAFPLVTWMSHVYGTKSPFVLLAACGLACAFIAPSRTITVRPAGYAGRLDGASARGLMSVLIFFTAQAAIWPFLEHMGSQRGVGDYAIAGALSFGALCGLIGSVVVTLLPRRFAGLRACVTAGALNVAAIITLAFATAAGAFALGLGGFNFAWAAFAPLQLNVLKQLRVAPQTFSLASSATTAGFGLGPLLGGATASNGQFTIPLAIGIAGTILALVLLVPAQRHVDESVYG